MRLFFWSKDGWSHHVILVGALQCYQSTETLSVEWILDLRDIATLDLVKIEERGVTICLKCICQAYKFVVLPHAHVHSGTWRNSQKLQGCKEEEGCCSSK